MKRRASAAARGAGHPLEQTSSPAWTRYGVWPALGVIAAGAFILHPGALGAPFYGDDFQFLDQVRGRSVWGAVAATDPVGGYFRPFSRQVLFWVVARASGESPLAFHLVNATLWLAVFVALFTLIRRIAGGRAAPMGVAFLALPYPSGVPLIWAPHPPDLMAAPAAVGTPIFHL